jgi:crotonobetainyl-CoA:carnitine CoA-transferase CaiB-like acyl-CoA transferase
MTPARSRGLGELRVVDVSSGVAGPYATRALAGYGARVIKVERPRCGDWARRLPPLKRGERGPDASALFAWLNAGKRGVTLDLTQPRGREVFTRLVAQADLVVEGIRPERKSAYGTDHETLRAANARIASVSVSNFGETGPYRHRPAAEITLQAIGGMMARNGSRGRPPLKMWGHQAQLIAGANVLAASMATLFAARRTQSAHHADVAILESVLQFLHSTLMKWSFERVEVGRDAVAAVANGVYPCADGYAGVIVPGSGKMWRRIPELMHDERLADERFRTLGGRVRHGDEVDALMLPWIVSHDKDEIYHEAQAMSLPFASVRNAKDILASPHLNARGYFDEVDQPGIGRMRAPGPPFRLASPEWKAATAPRLGEHNAEVFGELGIRASELREMEEAAIV